MGFLLYRYFPNARGSGIPQTKAALFARDGFISLRTVLGKFFCTATTLASGIPLGREGPSVQVGAGIGSVLGRWLGLRPEKVKALIPVGAAAAIAAAFNTQWRLCCFPSKRWWAICTRRFWVRSCLLLPPLGRFCAFCLAITLYFTYHNTLWSIRWNSPFMPCWVSLAALCPWPS